MTPQERQLIDQLFDRLATLENRRAIRMPSGSPKACARAERRLCAGADRAGAGRGAKAANAHIQELEGGRAASSQPRGFLDNMRDTLFGRDEPRGSVPRVPRAGRLDRRGGRHRAVSRRISAGYRHGYAGRRLPRAAAARSSAPRPRRGRRDRRLAADGRHPLGDGRHGAGAGRPAPAASGAPWGGSGGNAAGSDLSRDAGLDDIGSGRLASRDEGSSAPACSAAERSGRRRRVR